MLKTFDVAVVGAGIIGCSLARQLAGRGARVCLIDRTAPGQEASQAAAGMLAPSAEADAPSALFQFALASRRMYPAWTAELCAETGIDPHYGGEGTLLPFHSPEAEAQMRERLGWQAKYGVEAELWSSDRVSSAEPRLAGLAGAFHLPEDHQVDNRRLMQALERSCRLRGVELLLGQPALRILGDGGRAAGVEIGPAESPRTITAANIINASGAWASQLAGAGMVPPPVRPVKGHMFALRAAPGTLRHVVRTEEVYLIPRRDGRVIVGSTMEEAGFDRTVRAAPLALLLEAAQRFCPALASAEWLEAWTGLRPATPDGMPILGPWPGLGGYWLALGHFRNGILLAPATADLLTTWLLEGRPPGGSPAFSPTRLL